MIVIELVEGLQQIIADAPRASRYSIGIACRSNDEDGGLDAQQLGSFVSEDDLAVQLIPLGIGPYFGLDEQAWTASDLLAALKPRADLHPLTIQARAQVKIDGATVYSLDSDCWGIGTNDEHRSIFLMYGDLPDASSG